MVHSAGIKSPGKHCNAHCPLTFSNTAIPKAYSNLWFGPDRLQTSWKIGARLYGLLFINYLFPCLIRGHDNKRRLPAWTGRLHKSCLGQSKNPDFRWCRLLDKSSLTSHCHHQFNTTIVPHHYLIDLPFLLQMSSLNLPTTTSSVCEAPAKKHEMTGSNALNPIFACYS